MTRYYLVTCVFCHKEWLRKARKYQKLGRKGTELLALDVCNDCLLPKCKCGSKMEVIRLAQKNGETYFVCENCEIGYEARSYYSHPLLRIRVEELIASER